MTAPSPGRRPLAHDEPTVRIYITLPESMKAWVMDHTTNASEYIRRLIEKDQARAALDEAEQRERSE